MTNKPLVNVIIPTWNNIEYLQPCLQSLIKYMTPNLFDITVINNGHPESCKWIQGHKSIKVINMTHNAGWEGGIMAGLANTDAEFVVFLNDDTLIPDASGQWVSKLLQLFRNKKIAAVGPATNVVMGLQNIFAQTGQPIFEVRYLIGYCVMVRRSAFMEIGGMDMELSGGDDLDWSIRLRDAGYKLVVDKEVFIYHHGFKTGKRTMGDENTVNGWNSYEMTEKTNTNLIKKHGLKKWFDTLYKQRVESDYSGYLEDGEGDAIRKMIKSDKKILDLGCAGNKTLPRAVGVDYIAKGHLVDTLYEHGGKANVSQADIQADVSKELPVDDESQDAIIARHILEHMIDPVTTIELWLKKLKKGGRLIIAVPNQDIMNSIPMNIEHIHAYSPQSLSVLLSAMGLKIRTIIDARNGVSFIIEAIKI